MLRPVSALVIGTVLFAAPHHLARSEEHSDSGGLAAERGADSAASQGAQVALLEKELVELKESNADRTPVDYVFIMGSVLRDAAASSVADSQPGMEVLKQYAKTVFESEIGQPPDREALDHQIRLYLETFAHAPLNLDHPADGDKESVAILARLWSQCRNLEAFYSDFDPLNPSEEWKQKLDLEKILSSYDGAMASNMPPEVIKDLQIREEYTIYLENKHAFHRGSVKFEKTARMGRYFRKHAARYLATELKSLPMTDEILSVIRDNVDQPQYVSDIQDSIAAAKKELEELE